MSATSAQGRLAAAILHHGQANVIRLRSCSRCWSAAMYFLSCGTMSSVMVRASIGSPS